MLYHRCVGKTLIFLTIATGFLIVKLWPVIPEKLYLLSAYWPWMVGYWVFAWINVASLAYLVIKRFTLLETGRKLQHLDPMRNHDGLFTDELGNSDVRA